MKVHRAAHSIATLCRVLEVSPSGYDAWHRRTASQRAREDASLTAAIEAIHSHSRGTYGTPRVHAELVARGRRVSRKRVARLMRAAQLRGASRRTFVVTTTRAVDARPAPDLVQRAFTATGPNQLWVADITYIPTGRGFLYLAVVLDVWSRRIVGWAMETHLRTALVLTALDMAVEQRQPRAVIHHSDQGCKGEFHWSSQHLDDEVLRCRNRDGEDQTGRGGLRCVRLVGRRSRGVRSSAGSGRRSPGGCRVRMPLCYVGCRRPWVVVGSVGAVGCRRSAWRPDQLATCLLRSGKTSRF